MKDLLGSEQQSFDVPELAIKEEAASEQQRETPEVLHSFMAQIRYFTNAVKARLQTEESGNKIAELQGNCSGHIALMSALKTAGYEDFSLFQNAAQPIILYKNEDGYKFFAFETSWTLGDLLPLYNEVNALLGCEGWKVVQEDLNNRIQDKKNWLYAAAEKGRDMHYVHGWDFVIRLIDNWADCIKTQYLSAKARYEREFENKKEELPFDDDADYEAVF